MIRKGGLFTTLLFALFCLHKTVLSQDDVANVDIISYELTSDAFDNDCTIVNNGQDYIGNVNTQQLTCK